jgi:hypothetical protein
MSRTELRLVTAADGDVAPAVPSDDRHSEDGSCVDTTALRVVSSADAESPPDDAA